MSKTIPALIAVLAALLTLAACGTDERSTPQTQAAANGDEFNEADVDFATSMIQHHAQALVMVDHTMGRRLDPEIQQLADSIRTAQVPQIEQMVDWLTDWGQPIPATVRDHANAHGHGDADIDPDMPGMVSGEQMAELESATDAEFPDRWLTMMIAHHEGAVEMARQQQADGAFAPATRLARRLASSQQDEIETMRVLLGS